MTELISCFITSTPTWHFRCLSLRRWWKHVGLLAIRFTWCLKCKFSVEQNRDSEVTPSRTSLGWTSAKSIVRVRSADDSCRRDVLVPNQISSVCEAFSCNRRDAHQFRRTTMQDVRRWRATGDNIARIILSALKSGTQRQFIVYLAQINVIKKQYSTYWTRPVPVYLLEFALNDKLMFKNFKCECWLILWPILNLSSVT